MHSWGAYAQLSLFCSVSSICYGLGVCIISNFIHKMASQWRWLIQGQSESQSMSHFHKHPNGPINKNSKPQEEQLSAASTIRVPQNPNTVQISLKWTTTYSLPTLIGAAGHQWMIPTNIGYSQWLSLAKPTLKVALAGRCRSLLA